MTDSVPAIPYGWESAEQTTAHPYLLPAVVRNLRTVAAGRKCRVLDLGCGNGYVASVVAKEGHSVTGVDVSPDGIAIARKAHPGIEFELASIYNDDLRRFSERFDCVISLEVVEHLMYPKELFRRSCEVLKPGGSLILSTPHHGYWKNLALSIANGWDQHFNVEWDGGHVKFFSNRALAKMALAAGLGNPRFEGVGRLPLLWKSTVMVVTR